MYAAAKAESMQHCMLQLRIDFLRDVHMYVSRKKTKLFIYTQCFTLSICICQHSRQEVSFLNKGGSLCKIELISYWLSRGKAEGESRTSELCRALNPHIRYSLSNIHHIATRGNKKCGLCPYLINSF